MELTLERKKKHLRFIQKPKMRKNRQFGAVADIYIAKNAEIPVACNVNQ